MLEKKEKKAEMEIDKGGEKGTARSNAASCDFCASSASEKGIILIMHAGTNSNERG